MTDLLDYIDDQIQASCTQDIKFYGLCHLIGDDNANPYPATYEQQSEKVSPDDRYIITIYHRLLDGNLDPREEVPFGKSVVIQPSQRVRTVVFIKMNQSHSKIDEIVHSLPDTFEVDGYSFANVSKSINLLRDQNAIWEDEFGDAYKDKMIKEFYLYALEYDLQYVKCSICV